MPLQKNQTIQLTIDSLSSDGNGVGRHEGQVVFVPNAAVGDRLSVKIVKAAKNHAYGRIVQVVTPGPGRISSDCPISGTCGGCAFRHLSYAAELAAKQGFVADALARIGGISLAPEGILPSPLEARYRNKVQYPLAPGAGGGLCYGFYAARSHRVVPCADCLLQPVLLNRIAADATALLAELGVPAYDEATRGGVLRHLYLRQSSQTGEVLACLVATRRFRGMEALAAQLAAQHPEIKTVVLNLNPAATNVICGKESVELLGDGYIGDSLCGVPVRLGVHSFFQVNAPAAAGLFALVRRLAAPTKADTLLDLYCGTGVIGLSMAGDCGRLLGVEVVPEAVESARASAAEMEAHNAHFTCESAGQAAARLAAEGTRVDIVTVDPPRKGMEREALDALLQMAPRRIVMVSCNPATLARDLALLLPGGYALQSVTPADLFPRTRHVESAALLERLP